MTDVNRVMDDEPVKAASVTVRVVNIPMNARTFVNAWDPFSVFCFAEIGDFLLLKCAFYACNVCG